MMSTEQWTFFVSLCALVVACLMFGVLLLHMTVCRRMMRVAPLDNMDAILDAIDGVRDQVDSLGQHTQRENEAIVKSQETMSGRLQFMMAEKIAFELGAHREKQRKDADSVVGD
jgi:hypothetical protein